MFKINEIPSTTEVDRMKLFSCFQFMFIELLFLKPNCFSIFYLSRNVRHKLQVYQFFHKLCICWKVIIGISIYWPICIYLLWVESPGFYKLELL